MFSYCYIVPIIVRTILYGNPVVVTIKLDHVDDRGCFKFHLRTHLKGI